MKKCRKCDKTIKPKDQLRYHNYPGIQKICKPCKLEASRKHNAKKYKTIKDNPICKPKLIHLVIIIFTEKLKKIKNKKILS